MHLELKDPAGLVESARGGLNPQGRPTVALQLQDVPGLSLHVVDSGHVQVWVRSDVAADLHFSDLHFEAPEGARTHVLTRLDGQVGYLQWVLERDLIWQADLTVIRRD